MGKEINRRIEQVKKHFNYTNEELGKVCGVSYTAIAKIINGDTKDPSVSLFIHISKKLKINIKWLLFGDGEMLENTSGGFKKTDHMDLKNQLEGFKMIIEAKDSEIETLKKIINLLEEKIEQQLIKKKIS